MNRADERSDEALAVAARDGSEGAFREPSWLVHGMGHAWSGGDDTLPFNDANGPDATALVEAFICDALA